MTTLKATLPALIAAISISCSGGSNDLSAQQNHEAVYAPSASNNLEFAQAAAYRTSGTEVKGAAVLRDPQMGNVPAYHLRMPQGYALRGGIHWERNAELMLPVARVEIQNAQKQARLTTYHVPIQQFHHSEMMVQMHRSNPQMGLANNPYMQQQPVLPMEQAAQALLLPQVQQYHGRVQVVSQEVIPDLDSKLWPGQHTANTPYNGVKLTLNYQEGGTQFTEEVYALYYQLQQKYQDGYSVMWGFDRAFGIAAPSSSFGKVQPELMAMASSFKTDDKYTEAVEQNIAQQSQRLQAQQQSNFAESQRAHQARQQAFRQQNDQWHQNQESMYRSNQQINDNMLGYQRYTDPTSGQERMLSNASQYQWTDAWGNIQGSNDINYNPNHHDTGIQYYQMQPVR